MVLYFKGAYKCLLFDAFVLIIFQIIISIWNNTSPPTQLQQQHHFSAMKISGQKDDSCCQSLCSYTPKCICGTEVSF